MNLLIIVFKYFYNSLYSVFKCFVSLGFYIKVFELFSLKVLNVLSMVETFLNCNSFYKVPCDSGLIVCLFYVFFSFVIILFIFLGFYCSCPLFYVYWTKITCFLWCGITNIKFKFMFYNAGVYLVIFLSYLIFLPIYVCFMFLLFLYLILFLLIFYYNFINIISITLDPFFSFIKGSFFL